MHACRRGPLPFGFLVRDQRRIGINSRDQTRGCDQDGTQALAVVQREASGDEAAPITAIGNIMREAELPHQLEPQPCNAIRRQGRDWRRREAVARQAWDNHGKGIFIPAAKARRIRQPIDYLEELQERPGSLVGHQDGPGIGAYATRHHNVNSDAVHLQDALVQPVDLALPGAPVARPANNRAAAAHSRAGSQSPSRVRPAPPENVSVAVDG